MTDKKVTNGASDVTGVSGYVVQKRKLIARKDEELAELTRMKNELQIAAADSTQVCKLVWLAVYVGCVEAVVVLMSTCAVAVREGVLWRSLLVVRVLSRGFVLCMPPNCRVAAP